MKRLILCCLLFAPLCVRAGPLDEALQIVYAQSAVLDGKAAMLALTQQDKVWAAKVRIGTGYARQETADVAGGFDMQARISIEIPLFSHEKRKAVSGERIKVQSERERLRRDFLDAVAALTVIDSQIQAAGFDLETAYKRLAWFKQAVAQQVIESAMLWGHYEHATGAEKTLFLAQQSYKAELEKTARRFGGSQWRELITLVDGHIKHGRSNGVGSRARPGID